MTDTTDLAEAQDEFVTAQHELFQLAAHGQYTHAPLHDRTTGKYLSAQEIEAGQRAYNELIRTAQERVQAATIRAAADWLRTEYPGPDLDRHIRCAAAALDRHAAEQAPDFAHARQVLGTTTGQPETEARSCGSAQLHQPHQFMRMDVVFQCPGTAVDRATVLNERADFFEGVLRNAADPEGDPRYWSAISDVIRGLRQQAAEVQQPTPDVAEATPDTLAPWLYQRFMVSGAGWDCLDEDDRSYWEHHARAVRRAVVRGGFKAPAVAEETTPCGNTQGLGTANPYKPCARPAGHPEAYCKDATGDHLFLPATPDHATEEPK